jgi:hypothetical protein
VEDAIDTLLDCSFIVTNEDDLHYSARMANHYLRLLNTSALLTHSHHPMQFPIIADSGANFYMFKEKDF